MATTYTTVGLWTGSIKSTIQTSESVTVDGVTKKAATGKVFKKEGFTVSRTRIGQAMSEFTSTVGTIVNGNSITIDTGNNTQISANPSYKFYCTSNDVEPVEGTDIWTETDTWDYWEEWTEITLPSA